MFARPIEKELEDIDIQYLIERATNHGLYEDMSRCQTKIHGDREKSNYELLSLQYTDKSQGYEQNIDCIRVFIKSMGKYVDQALEAINNKFSLYLAPDKLSCITLNEKNQIVWLLYREKIEYPIEKFRNESWSTFLLLFAKFGEFLIECHERNQPHGMISEKWLIRVNDENLQLLAPFFIQLSEPYHSDESSIQNDVVGFVQTICSIAKTKDGIPRLVNLGLQALKERVAELNMHQIVGVLKSLVLITPNEGLQNLYCFLPLDWSCTTP